MMRLVWFLCWLAGSNLQAQTDCDTLRILFYNLENFCHPSNDSLALDDDFTPEGNCHYTYARFQAKASRLARVIWNANGWQLPHLIGVCEVENEKALNELLWNNGLHQAGYRFIHADSQDPRGMDVALFYNGWLCKILDVQHLNTNSEAMNLRTRNVLYAKLIFAADDTLHVYVNHWPSKRGGAKESEKRRNHVAEIVAAHCDSVLASNGLAHMLLMGDFNSETDETCLGQLQFRPDGTQRLAWVPLETGNLGSHKFQGMWASIDHFFTSPNASLQDCPPSGAVVRLPFLLEPDEAATGVKPFRTYLGMRYHGGYSDHLPVLLHLPFR